MKIGVPKEIKDREYRVGLSPDCIRALVQRGHQIWVQKDAAHKVGFYDDDYEQAGATVVDTAAEVFQQAHLIVKVKEPLPQEFKLLNKQHTLFTFLHLAPNIALTDALLDSECIAIAYESVTDDNGRFPLLAPMSEIAGRLSVQVGAHLLEMRQGGRGVLLGGATKTSKGKVLVLGGGVVGRNAAQIAVGMGAQVTIVDQSPDCLNSLETQFGDKVTALQSSRETIAAQIRDADLVIGAAMAPNANAPKLITRSMLKTMNNGAVLVDVAIDQGGCSETSRPTSHSNPSYVECGVIHYCVSNIPGAVARTSTLALNNATLPFVTELADKGCHQALAENSYLRDGVNVYQGKLTQAAIAKDQNKPFYEISELL